jgi:hypothetical protein
MPPAIIRALRRPEFLLYAIIKKESYGIPFAFSLTTRFITPGRKAAISIRAPLSCDKTGASVTSLLKGYLWKHIFPV